MLHRLHPGREKHPGCFHPANACWEKLLEQPCLPTKQAAGELCASTHHSQALCWNWERGGGEEALGVICSVGQSQLCSLWSEWHPGEKNSKISHGLKNESSNEPHFRSWTCRVERAKRGPWHPSLQSSPRIFLPPKRQKSPIFLVQAQRGRSCPLSSLLSAHSAWPRAPC